MVLRLFTLLELLIGNCKLFLLTRMFNFQDLRLNIHAEGVSCN